MIGLYLLPAAIPLRISKEGISIQIGTVSIPVRRSRKRVSTVVEIARMRDACRTAALATGTFAGRELRCMGLVLHPGARAMRNVVMAVVVVTSLAASSRGLINIKLTADKTTLDIGETTTVRLWAQGTQAGLFAAAGSIVAAGPEGTLESNPDTFQWITQFAPTFGLVANCGVPGANGGWTGFGSEQTGFLTPDVSFAKQNYMDLAHYTVTCAGGGIITLTVVPAIVGGYKCAETNKSTAIGTITPVTIVGGLPRLSVTPSTGLTATGWQGGPFSPGSVTYTISNSSQGSICWNVANTQPWVTLSKTGGTLPPGEADTVVVSINGAANDLPVGIYGDTVTFTDTTNDSISTARSVSLTIPDPAGDVDGDGHVNVVDLLYLVDAWATTRIPSPNWNPVCDLDGNGAVDNGDFTIFQLADGSYRASPNWNPVCDLDGSGAVGSGDFTIFQAANGSYAGQPDWNPACDLNGDGAVDAFDRQIFTRAYATHPDDANWDPACDFNGNGSIDAADFETLQAATGSYWGQPSWNPACDFNGDSKVDSADLAILQGANGSHQVHPNWNPACDFNADGKVDGADLAILEAADGASLRDPNYDPTCDFNDDGWVDVIDLLILAENFGI